MAQIIWTEPALNDLNAIAEYIAVDNPGAAAAFMKRLFAHIEMLVNHPELGPRVPELLPSARYHQIMEPPCRVFYRHDRHSKGLLILGVMRGEKLFQKRLLQQRDKPDRTSS